MTAEEYWNGEGIRFLNPDGTLPSVEQRVKEGFKRGHEVGTTECQGEIQKWKRSIEAL